MGGRREVLAFCVCLAVCVSAFFHETLFLGKVLSPADVLFVSASFRGEAASDYEPANRLLMDPVLAVSAVARIQPADDPERPAAALERVRRLWNAASGERPECGFRSVQPARLRGFGAGCPRLDGRVPAVGGGAGHVPARSAVGPGPLGPLVRGAGLPVQRFPGRLAALPGHRGRRSGCPGSSWRPKALFRAPTARAAGRLAIVVALVVLGGHIQTSAHVLLAGGLYALARLFWPAEKSAGRGSGPALLGAGSVSRARARKRADPAAGCLPGEERCLERAQARAHGLVEARTAAAARNGVHGGAIRLRQPAARASQSGQGARREQLERVGGGLCRARHDICGWRRLAVLTRGRSFRVAFLAALALSGAWARFDCLPSTTCCALCLCSTSPTTAGSRSGCRSLWCSWAGSGSTSSPIHVGWRARGSWPGSLVRSFSAALACGIGSFEGRLKERALCALSRTSGGDRRCRCRAEYEARALRQVGAEPSTFCRATMGSSRSSSPCWPRSRSGLRRRPPSSAWVRPAVMGLVLVDLAGLGWGLNPAIGAGGSIV